MKQAARRILIGVAGLALVLAIAAFALIAPYVARVQRFSANPAAGYHADFYLYVSPGAKRAAEATILVQPNNSGTNSDDPAVHRKDAWWTGFGRHGIADELGVVLLVPAFVRPGEDWRIYTHALDRDVLTTARKDLARLDLQLLAMVDHARSVLEAQGVKADARFLLQGFSASGMFANRFAALHPDRVKGVAAGSPGGWPIAPLAHFDGVDLPYPIGVSDLAQLTGARFDSATYARVPQLIVMGSLDDNDSVDFRDGWDEGAASIVDRLFGTDPLARWPAAEKLYQTAGANARFLLLEGIGHDRKKLQRHTTEFFRTTLRRAGRPNDSAP